MATPLERLRESYPMFTKDDGTPCCSPNDTCPRHTPNLNRFGYFCCSDVSGLCKKHAKAAR